MFLFWQPLRYLYAPKLLEFSVEGSRQAPGCSLHVQLVMCMFFIAMVLSCQFTESSLLPYNQPEFFFFSSSNKHSWPLTQANAARFCYWKHCWATREGQLILCILHYQESCLGSSSQLQGSFHCARFKYFFSNAFPLNSSHLYLSPLPPSHPSPSQPDLSHSYQHLTTSTPAKCILFTIPKEIHVSPYSSTLPNFSGSMDYRVAIIYI